MPTVPATNNIVQDLPTRMFKDTGVTPVSINPVPNAQRHDDKQFELPKEYENNSDAQRKLATVNLLAKADFSDFETLINSKSDDKPMDLGIDEELKKTIEDKLKQCQDWKSGLEILVKILFKVLDKKIMQPIYFVFATDPAIPAGKISGVTVDNAKQLYLDVFPGAGIGTGNGFTNALGQFFGSVGILPEVFIEQNPAMKPNAVDLQALWHNTLNFYRQLTRLTVPLIGAIAYTTTENHRDDAQTMYKFSPKYFGLNSRNEIRARENLITESAANFNRNKSNAKLIATGCPLSYITINDHGQRITLTDALHKYLCEALDQFLFPHLDQMIRDKPNFLTKPEPKHKR